MAAVTSWADGADGGASGGGGGGGSSEPNWVRVTAADITSIVDPSPMLTGSVTDSSGRLQIPVSQGGTRNVGTGTILKLGMPAAVQAILDSLGADGAPTKRLLTRLTFGTNPGGSWTVGLGFVSTADGVAIAPGLAFTNTLIHQVMMQYWSGNDASFRLDAPQLLGELLIGGENDGSALMDITARGLIAAGGSIRANAGSIDGAAFAPGAWELAVMVTHHIITTQTDTLDVGVEYAVVDFP